MIASVVAEQTWPIVPSKLEVAERCAWIADQVAQIETLADEHGKIDSDEAAMKAIAYVDDVRKAEKQIEQRRKDYVAKPKEFIDTLNSIVKGYTQRLSAARDKVSQGVIRYRNDRKKQLEAQAAAQRAREEEEALARAEAMEKAGRTAAADQLLDIAATAPRPSTDPQLGKAAGITEFTRVYWKGEVVDMKALMRAVLDGALGELVTIEDFTVAKASLNAVADSSKTEGAIVHGIKVAKDEHLQTRS